MYKSTQRTRWVWLSGGGGYEGHFYLSAYRYTHTGMNKVKVITYPTLICKLQFHSAPCKLDLLLVLCRNRCLR